MKQCLYLYQQRVKRPQNVFRGSFEEYNQAQAGTGPQSQAQRRQARDHIWPFWNLNVYLLIEWVVLLQPKLL